MWSVRMGWYPARAYTDAWENVASLMREREARIPTHRTARGSSVEEGKSARIEPLLADLSEF